MIVKIIPNDRGNPPGKLADAELHFPHASTCTPGHYYAGTDPGPCQCGLLAGLKLIGFGIWERRGGGRSVTFPGRQYSVNGERRSFALLRPIETADGQRTLEQIILDAYDAHVTTQTATEA